jgi:hypothetical protein
MAGVATASPQPGVSVVSMSWGFTEGLDVLAQDEARYDSYFTTPGVTCVASTGDHGTADPEYPAFWPNVVAVSGTSLTLNAENSYNTETGGGYRSASLGEFVGSGGGISQYEAEPPYQVGVQSTGYRRTPDVSFVADPATGAWVAHAYNRCNAGRRTCSRQWSAARARACELPGPGGTCRRGGLSPWPTRRARPQWPAGHGNGGVGASRPAGRCEPRAGGSGPRGVTG